MNVSRCTVAIAKVAIHESGSDVHTPDACARNRGDNRHRHANVRVWNHTYFLILLVLLISMIQNINTEISFIFYTSFSLIISCILFRRPNNLVGSDFDCETRLYKYVCISVVYACGTSS